MTRSWLEPLAPDERLSAREFLPVWGWALVVGLVSGVVGGLFRRSVATTVSRISAGLQGLEAVPPLGLTISIVTSAAMVMAGFRLMRRFAPDTGGSGIPQIEGFLDGELPLGGKRVVAVKFLAGVLVLGSGMVLGREGPTIQMGGGLGHWFAYRLRFLREHGRVLVAAGSAAGLAAAFHAPLAGALFVMEEMNPRFRTPVFSYIAVLLACVTAIIGLDLVYAKPALELEIHPAVPHASLWIFVVTGIVLGGFGYLFNRALVASLDGFAKLSAAWNRWIPLMVGGLVGLLAWLFPATDGRNEQLYHPMVGGGEETIIWSLNDHEATPLLIALAAMRFGLTMLCYGSGAPGGIFAPMLSISALVSQTLARLFHSLVPTVLPDPGALVIVGMGALVAATVGAPLTAIVLSLEITRNFNLGIPMITTAITATLVAKLLGGGAIYTTLLRRMVGR